MYPLSCSSFKRVCSSGRTDSYGLGIEEIGITELTVLDDVAESLRVEGDDEYDDRFIVASNRTMKRSNEGFMREAIGLFTIRMSATVYENERRTVDCSREKSKQQSYHTRITKSD